MRILLDATVLTDLYTERFPDGRTAERLLSMENFGDAELWVSAQSLVDAFELLRDAYDDCRLREAMIKSLDVLKVCSLEGADVLKALERGRPDLSASLLLVCAEKIPANFLLTHDAKRLPSAGVSVFEPDGFFDYLETEYRLVYETL